MAIDFDFEGLEEGPEVGALDAPVPKKRGRKSNAERAALAAAEAVDPLSATGDGDSDKALSDEPGVRINRKRKPKADSISLEGWAEVLQIGHSMFAVATKNPELKIDEEEAKALSKASSRLMARYQIPAVPAWAGDWILFAQVAKQIYGPRVAAIGIRKAMEKASRRGPQPAKTESNVVNMKPPEPPPLYPGA